MSSPTHRGCLPRCLHPVPGLAPPHKPHSVPSSSSMPRVGQNWEGDSNSSQRSRRQQSGPHQLLPVHIHELVAQSSLEPQSKVVMGSLGSEVNQRVRGACSALEWKLENLTTPTTPGSTGRPETGQHTAEAQKCRWPRAQRMSAMPPA